MRKLTKCLLVALSLFLAQTIFAQKEANNWVFGSGPTGIVFDFNTTPFATHDAPDFSTVTSCSAISHPTTGKLLLYTDGNAIFNKTHNPVLNGDLSWGAMDALIVPLPCNSRFYYAFYIKNGAYTSVELRYSIVDTALALGQGMVLPTAKNISVKTDCVGSLTAVRHANGVDIWIIVQAMDGNYYSYLLTAAGWTPSTIPTPVVSSGTAAIPSSGLYPWGFPSLKASNDGSKIASVEVQFNNWEVYDFNKISGQLSHSLTLPAAPGDTAVDVAFSPNGKVLYGSSYPLGCNQWNLDAGSVSDIVNSRTIVGPAGYGIQLAPNGKIYATLGFPVQLYLDIINDPDKVGAACNYAIEGFYYPTSMEYGLPNIPLNLYQNNLSLGPDTKICAGQKITLNPGIPESASASFLWQDGSTAPTYTATDTGTYWVQICGKSDTIKITACEPAIPNVFTPNGDGKNDLFSVTASENVESMETTIYDRWGTAVFNTNNVTVDWDGKNKNGKDVTDGTYFYVIRCNEENNNSKILKGQLQLVR
jgi:gliding motility-associated-like protein